MSCSFGTAWKIGVGLTSVVEILKLANVRRNRRGRSRVVGGDLVDGRGGLGDAGGREDGGDLVDLVANHCQQNSKFPLVEKEEQN